MPEHTAIVTIPALTAWGAALAEWLVASHGRVVMTLLALFPVLPMCLLTRMRSVRAGRSATTSGHHCELAYTRC